MATVQAKTMWRLFGLALIALIILDIPWVLLNKQFGVYKNRIDGAITHPAAVLTIWLMILVGEALLLSYVISHATTWWIALLSGMFVGLVIYMTFNGTSIVSFRQWGWVPAVVDTMWGATLLGLAATFAFTLTFGRRKINAIS